MNYSGPTKNGREVQKRTAAETSNKNWLIECHMKKSSKCKMVHVSHYWLALRAGVGNIMAIALSYVFVNLQCQHILHNDAMTSDVLQKTAGWPYQCNTALYSVQYVL